MSVSEKTVNVLQKQVQANALGLVVLSIDLYFHKAQIAQRRWGSPGGNDVAQEHYQQVQTLLSRTAWPSELEEAACDLEGRIAHFRTLLKAKDVTRVSFEATRLAAAFRSLQEGLLTWASTAAEQV